MNFDSYSLQSSPPMRKFARRCSVTEHSLRQSAILAILAVGAEDDDDDYETQPPIKRVKYSRRCSITQQHLRQATLFAKLDDQDISNSNSKSLLDKVFIASTTNNRKYQRRCSVTERPTRAPSPLGIAANAATDDDRGADLTGRQLTDKSEAIPVASGCDNLNNLRKPGINPKKRALVRSYSIDVGQRKEDSRRLKCRLASN